MLTNVSLFAGLGGFDLAAEWAGIETVCFVEIDPFCQKVLRKHWPDVPIIGDVHDVTKETLADATRTRSAIGHCQSETGEANLPEAIQEATTGGQLNPDWVCAMMGFPPGWLDIENDGPTAPGKTDSPE